MNIRGSLAWAVPIIAMAWTFASCPEETMDVAEQFNNWAHGITAGRFPIIYMDRLELRAKSKNLRTGASTINELAGTAVQQCMPEVEKAGEWLRGYYQENLLPFIDYAPSTPIPPELRARALALIGSIARLNIAGLEVAYAWFQLIHETLLLLIYLSYAVFDGCRPAWVWIISMSSIAMLTYKVANFLGRGVLGIAMVGIIAWIYFSHNGPGAS